MDFPMDTPSILPHGDQQFSRSLLTVVSFGDVDSEESAVISKCAVLGADRKGFLVPESL